MSKCWHKRLLYRKPLGCIWFVVHVFTIYLLLRSLQQFAEVDVTLPSTASRCSDWVFCGIVFHYSRIDDDIAVLLLAADTFVTNAVIKMTKPPVRACISSFLLPFSLKCTKSWLQKSGKQHFQRAIHIVSRLYLLTLQAAASVHSSHLLYSPVLVVPITF